MIDTDKYEGHTPAPWTIDVHKVGKDISAIVIESNMTTHSNCVLAEVEVENKYAEADAQLIADAPLLLDFIVWVKSTHPHYYHRLTEAYQNAKNND